MTLLEIVNQKAQSLDVQYAKAEIVSVDDLAWNQVKARVDRLPANLDMIAEMMKKKVNVSNGIRTESYGKCSKEKCVEITTRIEFDIESDPYLVMFISYSCPQHGTKNAQYIVLNRENNSSYRKQILKNYDPQI